MILPFRLTATDLDRLIRLAVERGDDARATELLILRGQYLMRGLYARMAKQAASVEEDPDLW